MDRRRRRWVMVLLVGAVLAGVLVLAAIRPLLPPFGLAVAVAYLISPLVGALERRGLRRSWAILTVYCGLGLGMAVVVFRLLPAAYKELIRLGAALPDLAGRAREWVVWLQARLDTDGTPPVLRQGLEQLVADLETRLGTVLGNLVENLFGFVEWSFYLVLAPILAYYMLRDLDQLRGGFARTMPRRWRQPALELVHGVDRVLAGFVRGQLLLGLMVGVMAAAATSLLGLRYSLLLGLWAGVAELVPYVGPLIGAAPAVLAGLAISPVRGLQVVLAFAIMQHLENAVLGPRVMGDAVGLHPLAIVTAVLAGGALAGIPGLILGVPVVAVLRVVWLFVLRRLVLPRPVSSGWAEQAGTRERGPV